jgi:hypothetical protein
MVSAAGVLAAQILECRAGLPHDSARVPRLLWRDAQGIEGSLDLTVAEIKVGRAMDCAIRTDDAMVSRHHARVYWGGGGYLVEDLSSANGVYFQEQRVQSHLMQHGDAVRCGSLWLRFVDGGGSAQPVAGAPPPMMQAPGLGPVASAGPTAHVAAINASVLKDVQQPTTTPVRSLSENTTPPPSGMPAGLGAPIDDSDAVRVLRRRMEQLQTELRIFRANKAGPDHARRMEQLEGEVATLEIERDGLKAQVGRGGGASLGDATNAKVQRALAIAAACAETAAALNDVLSSLRIEVMAAEGALDQHAQAVPRPSFELMRQSLRDAAAHCDEARDMLRRLREQTS